MAATADILLIAPHPDDPEFGAGGTIARMTKEGKSVVFVICTNGDKGTDDITMKPETLVKIRKKEQSAAAKALGVREVVYLGHPDQGLEDTSDFRKELVALIRKYRPETVLTSDPYRRYSWHRDHRICGQVTLDALFPYARDYFAYPDLIERKLMPHKVREALVWGSEDPNYFSDISTTFDLKIAALRCHVSQIGEDNTELEDHIRQRAKKLAEGKGFEYAEAFHRVEYSD